MIYGSTIQNDQAEQQPKMWCIETTYMLNLRLKTLLTGLIDHTP